MAILLDTLRAIPDFLFGPEDKADDNTNENKGGTPSKAEADDDDDTKKQDKCERETTESSEERPRESSVDSSTRSPSVSSDWNVVDLSGESLFKMIVDRHPLAIMNQSLNDEDSPEVDSKPMADSETAAPRSDRWSLLPSTDDMDRLGRWEKVIAGRPIEEVHRSELRPLVHSFGVPAECRPKLWKIWATKRLQHSSCQLGYADALALLLLHPDDSSALDAKVVHQIDMDIPRTATGIPEEKMARMRTILMAYALRNPSVGYCQGMNFIVNALLSVPAPGLDDETAYLVLAAFVEVINKDYYDKKNLRGFLRDISRLDRLLAEHFPEIKKLLDGLEISRLWLCAEPMLCLWSKSLAMHPARLWDIFLLDGTDAVLAAMLASLELVYPKLKRCAEEGEDGRKAIEPGTGSAVETADEQPKDVKPQPMEVLQERVVCTFKSSLRDLDVDELARDAVQWIEPCRESRRKARQAQERAEAEKKLIVAGYGFAPLSFAWRNAEA
ncbi:hypothetical protein FOL47_005471 [Perkinsus chesapeaki]|uniref:Rab-GAP TBC domain-containing protein n=1 Tax=Perkinsus chesapeaki TaxID=330153 RepID=A0A7J6LXC8_PERCH|nr:hypothetical protein FOL47_005471 [Perkinsus chesapeaki]